MLIEDIVSRSNELVAAKLVLHISLNDGNQKLQSRSFKIQLVDKDLEHLACRKAAKPEEPPLIVRPDTSTSDTCTAPSWREARLAAVEIAKNYGIDDEELLQPSLEKTMSRQCGYFRLDA